MTAKTATTAETAAKTLAVIGPPGEKWNRRKQETTGRGDATGS